jgi:hypothetical protein
MFQIKTDISSLTIKVKQLKQLEIGKLSNYKSAILAKIQPVVSNNFESQNQGKWARLTPATIKQKQRQGFPAIPLVRTGSLKRSVDNLTIQPAGQGQVLIISPGGDNKIKRLAQFQQLGTKTIPSRPFLVVNIRLSEIVTRLVVEEEIKNIKKSFQ